MNFGKNFKPDNGTGLPKPHDFIDMQKSHEKLKKWMQDEYKKFYKEQEDWMDARLRELIPKRAVDMIIKYNSMLPARFFGVSVTCIELGLERVEVMVIIKRGDVVAAKMFFPPSLGVS